MIIGQIKDGIVLDHIPAGRGMYIYNVLGLGELDCTVAMIKNADSEKMGHKDIIKVGQIIDIDLDVLGFIDPGITVNIIKDGKLAKRKKLELPEKIVDIMQCKNPRCITSVERGLRHEFKLVNREKRLYSCIYCESELPKL